MYTSSGYVSKTKSPSSPHPIGLRRRLDFLNSFESEGSLNEQNPKALYRDSSEEEEGDQGIDKANFVDEEREYQLLVRRGWTYSIGLALTWCSLTTFYRMPGVVAVTLLVLAFPQRDIKNAIGALLRPTRELERGVFALHRKPSFQQNYETRGMLVLMPQERNIADMSNPYTYITLAVDPKDHPDMKPRRSWKTALENAAPVVLEQYLTTFENLFYHVRRFFIFQAFLRLLVTIAQHLGAHFHYGRDDIGFFPRYLANLMSMKNLVGADGLVAVTTELRFVFGWWYDWIVGPTLLFTWQLPKYVVMNIWEILLRAVTMPEENSAWEYWVERLE